MSSFSTFGILTACSLILLAYGIALEPARGLQKRSIPESPEGGNMGDPSDFHSFRCPFNVPRGSLQELDCVDFIMDCGCMYDDMIISQDQCVINNRTHYEERVSEQLRLEKLRDERRVENQGPSAARAEPYYEVLDCLSNVPGILAREEQRLMRQRHERRLA